MLVLLQLIANLAAFAFGLSLLCRLFQVNYYNLLVQRLLLFTDPPLTPLRKVLPRLGRLDLAGVLVICLLKAAPRLLAGDTPLPLIAIWSPIEAAMLLIQLLTWAIFLLVIMSWVAPQAQHPAAEVIYQLSYPLLLPFRRLSSFLPLDISPIFALAALTGARWLLQEVAEAAPLWLEVGF